LAERRRGVALAEPRRVVALADPRPVGLVRSAAQADPTLTPDGPIRDVLGVGP
jgi:hypothetical protein